MEIAFIALRALVLSYVLYLARSLFYFIFWKDVIDVRRLFSFRRVGWQVDSPAFSAYLKIFPQSERKKKHPTIGKSGNICGEKKSRKVYLDFYRTWPRFTESYILTKFSTAHEDRVSAKFSYNRPEWEDTYGFIFVTQRPGIRKSFLADWFGTVENNENEVKSIRYTILKFISFFSNFTLHQPQYFNFWQRYS